MNPPSEVTFSRSVAGAADGDGSGADEAAVEVDGTGAVDDEGAVADEGAVDTDAGVDGALDDGGDALDGADAVEQAATTSAMARPGRIRIGERTVIVSPGWVRRERIERLTA